MFLQLSNTTFNRIRISWLSIIRHVIFTYLFTTMFQVALFQEADDSFIRALSLMLKPVLFMPKDLIVMQGDVGDEMYFICRGVVSLRLPNLFIYSQLRLSRISGDLTNHFDLDEIWVTVLYKFVCLG